MSLPMSGSAPERVPRPGPVDAPELSAVADTVLTDVAVLRRQVEHLLEDRARRTRIDQARGILMHRYAMNPSTALRTLHRWSRLVDLPVDALAEAVVTLTVSDDSLPELPRDLTHTVSRLLRRELATTPDQHCGARSLPRRP